MCVRAYSGSAVVERSRAEYTLEARSGGPVFGRLAYCSWGSEVPCAIPFGPSDVGVGSAYVVFMVNSGNLGSGLVLGGTFCRECTLRHGCFETGPEGPALTPSSGV